jgi:preprotein translocase subunit YajC
LLQQQTQPSSFLDLLPLFIPLLAIWYFLVILPARRDRKKAQEMLENLKAGDKVITNGGIYGTIVGFKEDRIQLRVAENVKIEIARNAVASLQISDQEQTKS